MEEVKIPFTLEYTGNGVDDAIGSLKSKMQAMKDVLNSKGSSKFSADMRKDIESTITYIEKGISEISKLQAKLNEPVSAESLVKSQKEAVDKAKQSLAELEEKAKEQSQEYLKSAREIKRAQKDIYESDYGVTRTRSAAFINTGASTGKLTTDINEQNEALKRLSETNKELKDSVQEAEKAVAREEERLRELESTAEQVAKQINKANSAENWEIGKEISGQLEGVQESVLGTEERIKAAQDDITNSVKNTASAMKDVAKAEQAAAQKSLADARSRASSNYYVLRSLKMLLAQIENLRKAVIKLDKLFVKFSATALKVIGKLALGFKAFSKSANSATKTHNSFVGSLKTGFMTILKYTLGIRSFYFLINKLRGALEDSMGNLATASSHVNAQMSSLLTNITWMKNMIATVAQSLLNVLVPALDAVANACNRAAYAVASFFATLTGQSFLYKAIKTTQDYAASLDSASDSANKAVRSFDKLNVITSESDDGSGGAAFSEAEILPAASNLAQKVKDIFATIFDPIKKAWDEKGKFVMDSWKYACEEVWSLVKSIGSDLLEVWSNDVGVQIWENIFQIVGDVGLIIGNLAKNFREAWEEGEKGKKILESIQALIAIIIEGLKDVADWTVEWSKRLDFNPLLEETVRLLEAMKKPVQFIVDTFTAFWEKVLMPFREYLIESGLPHLMQMIEQIIDMIDWDLFTERMNTLMDALGTLMPKVFEALIIVLGDLGQAFADIVNSDALDNLIDKFKEWAENVSPEELAENIEQLIKVLGTLSILVTVANWLVQAAISFMTFRNVFLQADVAKAVKELTTVMGGAGESAGLSAAISSLGSNCQMWFGIIKNSLAVGGTSFTTFAGILGIVVGAITNVTSFMDMFTNGFSVGGEVLLIFGAALTAVGAILLGAPALIAVAVAAVVIAVENIIVAIQTMPEEFANTINSIGEWFGSLPEKFDEWVHTFLTETLPNFAENLGVKAGEAMASFIDAWKDFPENFKKWIDEVNWLELGLNIVKGILFIFTLPSRLLGLIISAIGTFLSSFIEGFASVFDSHSPAQTMVPLGENIINGILQGIVDIVLGIGSWIKEHIFQPIFDKASDLMNKDTFTSIGSDLIEGLKNGISDKWNKVKDTISGIWGKVTEGAKSVFGVHSPSTVFNDMGSNILDGLKNGLAPVWDNVKALWTGLQDKIAGVMSNISKSTENTFSTLASGLQATSDVIKTNVVNSFSGMQTALKSTSEALKANLVTTFSNMSSSLNNITTSYKKMTLNTFSELNIGITKVVDIIKTSNITSFTELKDTLVDIFNVLQETVLSIFEGIKDGIKDIINNGIITLIEGMVNSIANGVNSIIDGIKKATTFTWTNPFTKEKHESKGISLPKMSTISIPRLAQGAVIPPNKEFLAMLGDQKSGTNIEAPLDTIVDAFNRVNNNTEELRLLREQNKLLTQLLAKDVSIASRDIFNSVRSEAKDYYGRTGNSAFVY